MRFARLLTDRLQALDMTQVQLATHLTDRGIPTTKQSVHAWCTGETRPETWKRNTLYDVLAVPLAERADWTEALLARRDRPSDSTTHLSSESDDESVTGLPQPATVD